MKYMYIYIYIYIYILIKYIKSVLWRVAKRLSYKQEARCLKVKDSTENVTVEDVTGFETNP